MHVNKNKQQFEKNNDIVRQETQPVFVVSFCSFTLKDSDESSSLEVFHVLDVLLSLHHIFANASECNNGKESVCACVCVCV